MRPVKHSVIDVDEGSLGSAGRATVMPEVERKIEADEKPLPSTAGIFEGPWISILLLALTVAAGAIPRLNHIGKSLWTSEAWVVNSALSTSLRQIFTYDGWLQTTPPLFLLIVRETVHVFGLSTFTLRAVPFVLSILSLLFLALLSHKVLRTPFFAVLCVSLLAISPPAVVFAKQVKQYSGDLAATCFVLFLSWIYLKSPDRRHYVLLFLGLSIALFLSYSAVCFVPLVLWLVLTAEPSSGTGPDRVRRSWARPAGVGLVASLISTLNYWLFVRPNTAPQLTQFWAEGYPTFSRLRSLLNFYAEYFVGMGIEFYLPSQSKEAARGFLSALGYAPLVALGVACVVVVWIAGPVLRRSKPYRDVLLLCFLPVLTLAGINLLHLYPVSVRRLTLFIFPCIALATTVVLQAAWDRLTIPAKVDRAGMLSLFLSLSCIVLVLIVGTHADYWANYVPEDEDAAAVFQNLKSEAKPDDIVYVHASLIEPAQLYFRMLGWKPEHVYFGQTGFPCCTRKVEPELDGAESERAYVVDDVQHGGVDSTKFANAWFVFTARKQHWGSIGRDERQIIANYLLQRGCKQELQESFTNVELMEYSCAHSANGSSR